MDAAVLRYGYRKSLALLAAGFLMVPLAQAQQALKSLGPMPDPTAAALAPKALADLNRMITQGDAYFDPNQGVACKVDMAERQKEANKWAAAASSGIKTTVNEAARSMVSGVCPGSDGVLSGPIEYIDVAVSRTDMGSLVMDTDIAVRERAVYMQGRPVGESVSFMRNRKTNYHRLLSGELVAPQDQAAKEVSYSVNYVTGNKNGSARVLFSFDTAQKIVSVVVTESPDGVREVMTIYNDGKPFMRSRSKNGNYHGWMEYFDPYMVENKMDKVCYQNGTQIKALQCPDT